MNTNRKGACSMITVRFKMNSNAYEIKIKLSCLIKKTVGGVRELFDIRDSVAWVGKGPEPNEFPDHAKLYDEDLEEFPN